MGRFAVSFADLAECSSPQMPQSRLGLDVNIREQERNNSLRRKIEVERKIKMRERLCWGELLHILNVFVGRSSHYPPQWLISAQYPSSSCISSFLRINQQSIQLSLFCIFCSHFIITSPSWWSHSWVSLLRRWPLLVVVLPKCSGTAKIAAMVNNRIRSEFGKWSGNITIKIKIKQKVNIVEKKKDEETSQAKQND